MRGVRRAATHASSRVPAARERKRALDQPWRALMAESREPSPAESADSPPALIDTPETSPEPENDGCREPSEPPDDAATPAENEPRDQHDDDDDDFSIDIEDVGRRERSSRRRGPAARFDDLDYDHIEAERRESLRRDDAARSESYRRAREVDAQRRAAELRERQETEYRVADNNADGERNEESQIDNAEPPELTTGPMTRQEATLQSTPKRRAPTKTIERVALPEPKRSGVPLFQATVELGSSREDHPHGPSHRVRLRAYADPGSSNNLMDRSVYHEHRSDLGALQESVVQMRVANGNSVATDGRLIIECCLRGARSSMVPFEVIDSRGAFKVVLGKSWLDQTGAVMFGRVDLIALPTEEDLTADWTVHRSESAQAAPPIADVPDRAPLSTLTDLVCRVDAPKPASSLGDVDTAFVLMNETVGVESSEITTPHETVGEETASEDEATIEAPEIAAGENAAPHTAEPEVASEPEVAVLPEDTAMAQFEADVAETENQPDAAETELNPGAAESERDTDEAGIDGDDWLESARAFLAELQASPSTSPTFRGPVPDVPCPLSEEEMRSRREQFAPLWKIGKQLPPELRSRLLELLDRYADCFAVSPDQIQETNVIEHSIPLKDGVRPAKMPTSKQQSEPAQQVLRSEIAALLELGFISEADMNALGYCSPARIVTKASDPTDPALPEKIVDFLQMTEDARERHSRGETIDPETIERACAAVEPTVSPTKHRMVIPYMILNRHTKTEPFAAPDMQRQVSELSNGSKTFLKLDGFAGFHWVKIREEDRQKTAFSVNGIGTFVWNRMPFGLKGAPTTFWMGMTRAFGDLMGQLKIHLDDIGAGSNAPTERERFDELYALLEQVLRRARYYQMTFAVKKAELFVEEMTWCGSRVSGEGRRPPDEAIAAVLSMREPKNAGELQSIVSAVGYYADHIPEFWKRRKALEHLLKPIYLPSDRNDEGRLKKTAYKLGLSRTEGWTFDDQARVDLLELKRSLIESMTCRAPETGAGPFVLASDACKDGFGATLSQEVVVNGKTQRRLIACAGRKTTLAESKCSAPILELRALAWASKKFSPRIEYMPVILEVDAWHIHKALLSEKEMSNEMHRWRARILLNLDVILVRHIAGKNHAMPDALSRMTTDEPVPGDEATASILEAAGLEDVSYTTIAERRRARDRTESKVATPAPAPSEVAPEPAALMCESVASCLIESKAVCVPERESAESNRQVEAPEFVLVVHERASTESEQTGIPSFVLLVQETEQIRRVLKRFDGDQFEASIRWLFSHDLTHVEDPRDRRKVKSMAMNLRIVEGRVLHRGADGIDRELVPRAEGARIAAELHDQDHWALEETARAVRRRYFWYGLHADVEKAVRECSTCQKNGPMTRSWRQGQSFVFEPGQIVAFDTLYVEPVPSGKRRGKKLRVSQNAVDLFTGFTWANAAPSTTALDGIAILKKAAEYVVPTVVMVDQGSEFNNEPFFTAARAMGSIVCETPAYAHMVNGQIELANRLILERLRRFQHEETASGRADELWYKHLPDAVRAVNRHQRESTGYAPVELLFGKRLGLSETPTIEDVRDAVAGPTADEIEAFLARREDAREHAAFNRNEWQKRNREETDAGRQPPRFEPGDLVLVQDSRLATQHSEKLAPRWSKVARVVEPAREDSSSWILAELGHANDGATAPRLISGAIHSSRMKRWRPQSIERRAIDGTTAITADGVVAFDL